MINNEETRNIKKMKQILSLLYWCDVILTSGEDLFIGLTYNEQYINTPYILFKGSWTLNYYLSRIVELMGIPCIEQKLLTRELFEKVDEIEIIPSEYFDVIAPIYSRLEKYKHHYDFSEEEIFSDKLNESVCYQLFENENKVYAKKIRKYFLNQKICENLYKGDVVDFLKRELQDLSDQYDFNLKDYHNTAYKVDEFYLETFIPDFNIDFWQYVFVSEKEKKIYIATRKTFQCFDFLEADFAFGYIRTLIEACNKQLIKDTKKYCDEFKINPKQYELVQNSIKTLLEVNYNKTGIEYGYSFDNCVNTIYLKRPEIKSINDTKSVSAKNTMSLVVMTLLSGSDFNITNKGEDTKPKKSVPKMFEIVITHKEFLTHTDLFQEFIKNPKKMKKWNWYCKEKKYNPKKFDKKFQPIEQ